jgi:hypothetical protein
VQILESYLADLQQNAIALPFWGVVTIWLFIFSGAHVLHRKSRLLSSQQMFILTEPPMSNAGGLLPRLLIGQFVFAAVVFSVGAVIGDFGFTFFAGGWVVATAVSLGFNLRSVLFLRAIAEPGAANGAVSISPSLAVRDFAFQLFGAATFCLCLGILLAHLALLGGALFIAATGVGHLRRASALHP